MAWRIAWRSEEAHLHYDEFYRTGGGFGSEPEDMVRKHLPLLGSGRPILDVGAGQGRNALFLARLGYQVDAIDPSIEAAEALSRVSRDESLAIRAFRCGFEEFVPDIDCYSGILVFGLIPDLAWPLIETLAQRIQSWSGPGSLVFLSAFSVHDDGYAVARQGREIGRNSFQSLESGRIRTFLEPGEMDRLVPAFELLDAFEGFGPEHHHGDGVMHRHGISQAVFCRR